MRAACQYDLVTEQLSAVLDRLKAGAQYVASDDLRSLAGLSAQAHHVAASVLLKLDNHGLASVAADCSMNAALKSEDSVMIGASSAVPGRVDGP